MGEESRELDTDEEPERFLVSRFGFSDPEEENENSDEQQEDQYSDSDSGGDDGNEEGGGSANSQTSESPRPEQKPEGSKESQQAEEWDGESTQSPDGQKDDGGEGEKEDEETESQGGEEEDEDGGGEEGDKPQDGAGEQRGKLREYEPPKSLRKVEIQKARLAKTKYDSSFPPYVTSLEKFTPLSQPGKNVKPEANICHHLERRYEFIINENEGIIDEMRAMLLAPESIKDRISYHTKQGYIEESDLYLAALRDSRYHSETLTEKTGEVRVGVVIDDSGSMAGPYHKPRIEEARSILCCMLESMRGRAVEVYVGTISGQMLYTPQQEEDLYTAINFSASCGGTPTHLGLDTVASSMLANDTSASRDVIFVITDGEAQPKSKCLTVCRKLRNINIDVFGFGVGCADFSMVECFGAGKAFVGGDVTGSMPVIFETINRQFI